VSVPDRPLRLDCERCAAFTEYERDDENREMVYCDGCGKKHSSGSLYRIDPHADYPRDESGELLEKPDP